MKAAKGPTNSNIIGARLQAAIKRCPKKLGVRTLAELLKQRSPRPRGSTPAMIHRYIRGKVTPPVEFLRAAADVLGVDQSWLSGGSSAPPEVWEATVPDDELSVEELRRFAAEGLTTRLPHFAVLPVRTQRAAVEAVEAWAYWSLNQSDHQHENDPDTQREWTVREWGEAALYVGMTLAEALAPTRNLPEDPERDGYFLADVAIALLRRIPPSDQKNPPIHKPRPEPQKQSKVGAATTGPSRRKPRGQT